MEFRYESHLDKLKSIYAEIQGLHHFKKNDTSYFKARHLGTELKNLCPDSSNFKLDVAILNQYGPRSTEKEKEACLEEFKKEILYDLGIMIKTREQPPVLDIPTL